jgi:alkylation response protein AidB-like acyl-CoA dehydrogenase
VTPELVALRDTVRALIARTPPAEAWPKLCAEVGVSGLAIPERHGGVGAGLPELCVVAEELGRALTPAALLGSAALTATALVAADAGPLLPRIAAGDTAALAWTGADGRWDPVAPACRAEHGRLHGTAHYVLDGDTADLLVVAAHTPTGVALFQVDPADTERVATPALDSARPLGTVTLTGSPGEALTAEGSDALWAARDVARVVLAAEQVGAAAHCLETTVAYTKQREQYGHPIAWPTCTSGWRRPARRCGRPRTPRAPAGRGRPRWPASTAPRRSRRPPPR